MNVGDQLDVPTLGVEEMPRMQGGIAPDLLQMLAEFGIDCE